MSETTYKGKARDFYEYTSSSPNRRVEALARRFTLPTPIQAGDAAARGGKPSHDSQVASASDVSCTLDARDDDETLAGP
jgi:hypothetical protein